MHTIYWGSTSLIAAMLLWSAFTYLFQQATIEGIKALGFPDFFRIQLAVLKLLAIVVLLVPSFPLAIKEWAYAGTGLFFLTAIVAHIAHKDSMAITVLLLVFMGILAVSNFYLHKISQYNP